MLARVDQADGETINYSKDSKRKKRVLFGDDEFGFRTVEFEMPLKSAKWSCLIGSWIY